MPRTRKKMLRWLTTFFYIFWSSNKFLALSFSQMFERYCKLKQDIAQIAVYTSPAYISCHHPRSYTGISNSPSEALQSLNSSTSFLFHIESLHLITLTFISCSFVVQNQFLVRIEITSYLSVSICHLFESAYSFRETNCLNHIWSK